MSKQIHVLIVEDDESLREVLADFSNLQGYMTQTAIDGLEGLEILKSGKFDPSIILLDMNMPRLSGPDFAREKERLGLAPNAKILMLTASNDHYFLPEVTMWVKKPVDIDHLQTLIEKYG